MKRSEVKKEYTWDLSALFADRAAWEAEYKSLNKDMVQIVSFKGKLNDKDSLLKLLKLDDELSYRLGRLYQYARFLLDLNGTDNTANELVGMARKLIVNLNSMSSFILPSISSLSDEFLKDLISDPNFKDYDYMLSKVLKNKKHVLSEKEEAILAKSGNMYSAFDEIFSSIDNVDLPFPKITIDGKKEKLSHGKYSMCLYSKDRKLRKAAFEGMYKAVGSLINTTTKTFAASINKNNVLANIRGYKSALESAVTSNDVPQEIFHALVKNVNNNFPLLHEYMEVRRQVMDLPALHMYDLHVSIFDDVEISMDYETAFKTVLEGLKPMGEDYLSVLREAKNNRWIDVEETENKRSGAYSWGVSGLHPFVLLNYTPNAHDVFTIAHELGHAMHSYNSSKAQPPAKEDYVIFVAEVASTVNEVLLLKHMIKTTTDKSIKKYLLSYYLDMFRTTLFRQTMFAQFEQKIHEAEAKGTPLTIDSISDIYLKLNKKYYGTKSVKHDKQIRSEWARIPHFYRPFYVYQYATGITSAVTIANNILKNGDEAVKNYKKFLSAGSSKGAYEILKDAGVDLMTSVPYDTAFAEFKETLEELKRTL